MRGIADFETYNWTKPLCCGLLVGDNFTFLHEKPKHTSNPYVASKGSLVYRVLHNMAVATKEHGVTEWWAHNGGAFDWLLLLHEATERKWPVMGIPANGRLIVTEISVPLGKGEVIITLKDSYAVIQASLKRATQDFGLGIHKQFGEAEYSGDMRDLPLQRLRDGNYFDCLCLQRLLNTADELFTSHGGKLKSTFSSSALSVLKAKLKQSGRKMPSIPPELVHINEMARNAFYGGRVEVFSHAPQAPVTEYDVLSSYPKAMMQDMPWQYMGETTDENAYREYEGFSHAYVEVPPMQIPPLPFRDVKGGLFFPTGAWRGWYAHNELRYARALGCTVRPLQTYLFTNEVAPFAEFVTEFYKSKMVAVGAKREFDKLCLNGSFGKFAQKPEKESLHVFPSELAGIEFERRVYAGKEGDAFETREIGSKRVQAVKSLAWPAHTHYPIASYITADARIRLHKLLVASDSPAYCDTDSVHAIGQSHQRLDDMCGTWCGDLERKGQYIKAEYYAPKLYGLYLGETRKGCKGSNDKHPCANGPHWHYKSKGFSIDSVSFDRIINGEAIAQERIRKAKSQLRSGDEMTRERILKLWRGKSMKRKAYSLTQTRPWSVQEILRREPFEQTSPLYKGGNA